MNLRKQLLILAWVSFGASLLLPSIRSEGFFGFLPEHYWGFVCVMGSLLSVIGLLVNIIALPFGKHLQMGLVYAALFGLCNLLMLLSPAIIFFERKRAFVQKAAFKAVFIVAALLVCLPQFLSPDVRADLMVGYYVWCLSFILLAVAVSLRVVRQPAES